MKTAKFVLLGALFGAIAIVVVLLWGRPSRPMEPVAVLSDPAALTEPSQPALLKSAVSDPSPPILAIPRRTVVAPTEAGIEPVRLVRARSGAVLATVNHQQIQLKHLLPLGPDDTEMAMTAEEYESRLNRAIEIELIFQEAQARSLSWTAEQRQRLARIGQTRKARLAEYKAHGISWSSVTTPQLEFERRLMSALMLQQNLVALEVAAAPSPDADVQARYEQALREMFDRIKANASITRAAPSS